MKRLARSSTGDPLIGDEDGFVSLSSVDPSIESIQDALPLAPGDLPDPSSVAAPRLEPDEVDFGAPIAEPRQLWGIGLNFEDHAEEMGEERPDAPASFLKPPGTVTGAGGPIRLPPISVSTNPTAEAELGVVIGRRCRDISLDEANSVIAGYLPLIDVTADDIIRENPRFLTWSKRFDTFLVLGKSIACPTVGELPPMDEWTVRTITNGDVFAEEQLGEANFSPRELVSSLSVATTLDPGTIIATGTPGAAPITPDHTVRAEVDPIGAVDSTVTR